MRTVAATLMFLLASCGAPDRSQETLVDPDSVAGDHRGVTGTLETLGMLEAEGIAPRQVDVWLPESYASSPQRRYPVLYMHDGQNVFDPEGSAYSGWDWGVDEALTVLGRTDGLEAIVVAPHSVDATRFADYFPQGAAADHGEAISKDIGDWDADALSADAYLRFLVDDLKPRIDAAYRTNPGREHTAVMGSSMGALISLYAVTKYPDVFGQAGMVSTHFPMGDGALVDWFADRLPDPATHRLYFDFGTNTLDHNYEGYQDRMDAALARAGYERGVNWTTRKFEGHDHSERAWRNRVHVPLQVLLAGEFVDGGEER